MYYKKEIKEIFRELDTADKGLSREEAEKRLKKYGRNDLKKDKKISVTGLILAQFKDPLIYILLLAAVFTFFIDEYIDMWVILAVVLINAVVGFFQEFKAEKAMQAIRNLTSPKATAIRDSESEKIDASGLVPGDIIVLSSGSRVPADVRLFEAKDLHADESMFTGESHPAQKTKDAIKDDNVQLADQENMLFMGSVIVRGRGKGVVVHTAGKTELGKISEEVSATKKEKTPLQKRLADFSKIVGLISVGLAIFVFLIGLIKSKPVTEMILFSISMAVSVIPEGLPIVITITMAIGMKRMADRRAIIRKLIAVETLGSCDYICSDKTGTITQNRMTVTKAYANGKTFNLNGSGYTPKGGITKDGKDIDNDADLKKLLLTGLLCNSAGLYKEDAQWQVEGDPTEGSLLVSAKKYGLDIDQARKEYAHIDEIPFSSDRKYMAVLRKKDNSNILFLKGAPEKILSFSNAQDKKRLHKVYEEMANNGLRVLAFASKDLGRSGSKEEVNLAGESTRGLNFLGFQGIIDPPRESAVRAIDDTKRAGIKTVMVTGDHKITARAIADNIGILEEGAIVTDGKELDSGGESFLREKAEDIRVYARVSPSHKLRIVEVLQEKNHIVAVTGDGVNDAPALKRGNIGVSMGTTGTDVAREASDMVLKDDNFATIFEAVKVGRVIFENIRKVVFFLLATAVGVSSMIIIGLFLNLPLPFLATQILWVNLVTNGLQDIALAYEPGEKDISRKKPRNPEEHIINTFVLKRLFLIGMTMTIGTLFLFWFKLQEGASLPFARTVAFNTVVFFQLFHVLNSRSFEKSVFTMPLFSNPFLFISLFISIGAQVCVLYIPALQYIFHTQPLDIITWVQVIGAALSVIFVMEVDKFIRRKQKR